MHANEIKRLIEGGLPGAQVEVQGDDERHFEARVVAREFTGKSMVQQHQMVYRILGDKMNTAIHALSLKTLSPDQVGATGSGKPA